MTTGMIQALFSALCFGFLAIFAKLSYRAGLSEIEILHYRFSLGAVCFFLVLLFKNPTLLKIRWRFLLKTAFIGLVVCGLQSTFFFKALKRIPASTTSLILYFYPVAVALTSVWLFRFRLSGKTLFSLVLVSSGCLLVFYQAFVNRLDGWGVLFAFAAMLIFSLYMILMEWVLKKENPLTAAFYIVLFTALSFSLFHNPAGIFFISLPQFGISLLTGVVSTVLASYFLYRAIEKIGSAYTSIFSTFEPITTVMAAFFILGEPLVIFQAGGMLLIVAGILLPQWQTIKKALKAKETKS